PGAMNGDSSTAPMRPPPGPFTPGRSTLGPDGSAQHEVASMLSASSNVTISRPSFTYAGELVMRGTHVERNSFADTRPPGSPFLHGRSWPSWQRLGTMNEKLGVRDAERSAPSSSVSGTTFFAHEAESMIEWK